MPIRDTLRRLITRRTAPAAPSVAEAKARMGFGRLTPKTCSNCGNRRDVLTRAEAAVWQRGEYQIVDLDAVRKSMCKPGGFAIDSPTVQRCRREWVPRTAD